jgi:hypothetical protein
MIEGDIKSYFDNIDHRLLAEALESKIHDKNLMDLYWKMVKAGYVNQGNYEPSGITGVPQGGVLSPLLSNIYLHKFDEYMTELVEQYTPDKRMRGKQPKEYTKNLNQTKAIKNKLATEAEAEIRTQLIHELKRINRERRGIPSTLPTESTNRLYYARYADDWVIGVRGSRAFAEEIKSKATHFLSSQLKIQVNEDKTSITNMTRGKAHFLGVDIFRRNDKYLQSLVSTEKLGLQSRKSNNRIVMYAPIDKLINKLISQNYAHPDKRAKAITKWIHLKPEEIITRYNAVLRGVHNYYYHVENRNMLGHFNQIMLFSAAFTLARKLNLSPAKVFQKYGSKLTVGSTSGDARTRKVELAITPTLARQRMRDPTKTSRGGGEHFDPFRVKYYALRSHFVLDQPCKLCGNPDRVEMHHVKHIRKGDQAQGFARVMSQLNRKQIPVCRECHLKIHNGTIANIKKLSTLR